MLANFIAPPQQLFDRPPRFSYATVVRPPLDGSSIDLPVFLLSPMRPDGLLDEVDRGSEEADEVEERSGEARVSGSWTKVRLRRFLQKGEVGSDHSLRSGEVELDGEGSEDGGRPLQETRSASRDDVVRTKKSTSLNACTEAPLDLRMTRTTSRARTFVVLRRAKVSKKFVEREEPMYPSQIRSTL